MEWRVKVLAAGRRGRKQSLLPRPLRFCERERTLVFSLSRSPPLRMDESSLFPFFWHVRSVYSLHSVLRYAYVGREDHTLLPSRDRLEVESDR